MGEAAVTEERTAADVRGERCGGGTDKRDAVEDREVDESEVTLR